MGNRQKYTLIFILVASVITTVLCCSILSFYAYSKDDTPLIILKDGESAEQVRIELDNFAPGVEKNYKFEFKAEKKGDYSIEVDFEETKTGELKKYLEVVIKVNGEVLCFTDLNKLFNGEKEIKIEEDFIKNEILEFEICYKMPATVGNEAENAEADFNMIIKMAKEK